MKVFDKHHSNLCSDMEDLQMGRFTTKMLMNVFVIGVWTLKVLDNRASELGRCATKMCNKCLHNYPACACKSRSYVIWAGVNLYNIYMEYDPQKV